MINFFNHLLITIKKINHDYHSFCMQMTGQQFICYSDTWTHPYNN